MKIVIAPNSFKSSLDASGVARAISKGLQKSRLHADHLLFPIADGGDHTLEIFQHFYKATEKKMKVSGPLGKEVTAKWAMIKEKQTAVIEMAKASGVALLTVDELDPMRANSYGTGQIIKEAIKEGAKKIILGLGGSATVDGGLGILQALGGKVFDIENNLVGREINPALTVHSVDLSEIGKDIMETEFLVLCDVDNPLLGPKGAAFTFGPQKGADQTEVEELEKALSRLNNILKEKTGKDLTNMAGGAAAGGIAVILTSFFHCTVVNGIDYLLRELEFEQVIMKADLLITAEGKIDEQTLGGKGPSGVADLASKYGVPVIILTGEADNIPKLNELFTAVFPITNGPQNLQEAINHTEKDLETTATQIGNLISTFQKK